MADARIRGNGELLNKGLTAFAAPAIFLEVKCIVDRRCDCSSSFPCLLERQGHTLDSCVDSG